jgi:hypothetical protein
MARADSPALASAGRRIERIQARLTTTPGRLRLAAVLIAVGAIAYGVVAASAAGTRRQAAHAAATEAEPLLVEAEGLYASLSDADATAATTFLTGGLEPIGRRQRYVEDLRSASHQLSTLTQQVGGSSVARGAVLAITTQLPVYSGLVDTARADNRQGFPVGAAYLREASILMREQILPAARQLYEVEARRLNADYRSGVSGAPLLAVIAGGFLMLGLLVLAQVYVARLTHRILNVPMVAATALVVALSIWVIASFLSEQNALVDAQRTGSDSVQVLSAARILALRAQGDESLALVARGGAQQNLADFNTMTERLGAANGTGGLMGEAARIARRSGSSAAIDGLSTSVARYLAVHRQVAALEVNGRFTDAVNLAVGPNAKELPISDGLNAGLGQQIMVGQRRFDRAAADATSALSGLWLAIPLLAAVFALLALYGLRERSNEYR